MLYAKYMNVNNIDICKGFETLTFEWFSCDFFFEFLADLQHFIEKYSKTNSY